MLFFLWAMLPEIKINDDDSVSRGHRLKLVDSRCHYSLTHYDLGKYSFAVRV